MKLSVSALAWPIGEDTQAYQLLNTLGISDVELVPARAASPGTAEELKAFALRPRAFQALLFGTALPLFESESQRASLFIHLERQIEQAARLGVKRLIFGSPKNRFNDLKKISEIEAHQIALTFFSELGKKAAQHEGMQICLEPNPKIYGANFLVTTPDTVNFSRKVGSAGIGTNLDLGAVTINQEDLDSLLGRFAQEFGHLHISEPMLAPIHTGQIDLHRGYAKALTKTPISAGSVISIEMKSTDQWQKDLERSIDFVKAIYGQVLSTS